jgi:nitrous oxidase accessory protein NosD
VDDDNIAGPWDGTPGHPYQNITTALEHALDNDTILVNDGTYYENLIVTKNVTLMGENPKTTIIDGCNITMTVVLISKVTGVKVQGFTIRNSGGDAIVGGIHIFKSQNVKIYGNAITRSYPGVLLTQSMHCEIYRSEIYCNVFSGIYLRDNSSYNQIVGNALINHTRGIHFADPYSEHNNFYHNNLINNTDPVWSAGSVNNTWDDGYPSGGNYWSNYTGVDSDNDGIGESWYEIDSSNIDHYPLMGTFSDFKVTSEHHVQTICNSSISDFQFNGKAISFDVTGDNGTTGFCRICIPTALMNVTYKVFVNGTEVSYNLLPCSNETYSYLYFNYTHSTQEVIIIPEFPSFVILPLFMVLSITVVTVAKKRFRRKT